MGPPREIGGWKLDNIQLSGQAAAKRAAGRIGGLLRKSRADGKNIARRIARKKCCRKNYLMIGDHRGRRVNIKRKILGGRRGWRGLAAGLPVRGKGGKLPRYTGSRLRRGGEVNRCVARPGGKLDDIVRREGKKKKSWMGEVGGSRPENTRLPKETRAGTCGFRPGAQVWGSSWNSGMRTGGRRLQGEDHKHALKKLVQNCGGEARLDPGHWWT